MTEAIETIEYKGHTIKIHQDECGYSPRENDNICEFHCSHRNYNLGDKGFNYRTGKECCEAALERKHNGDIMLPLYLYDHSGITISLTPFSCPWDSGQVGFVVVPRKAMLENWGNKIYLVTKQYIDTYHPCPIKPLTVGDVPVSISCGEIYHPVNSVPVDVTFVAMTLNSNSGKVEQKTSFVGSSGSSVVYMSEQGIYLTYSYSNSIISFFAGFLKEAASDLFPQHLVDRINKLDSYDISEAAKMMEFGIIIEKYQNSLDDDERMRIENEMENRMVDYYKKHRRELERTGIVKIGLKDLTIQASGSVPGYPLNQFALDEYNNDLRIATTIGENWNVFNSGGESANDVYVLDSDLKLQGFVQDLGLGERIYSVRFLGEMGYVVTYRQIDPFYVLDLSDPKNPEVKGELKIPGYSSYLHPLAKDRILGIGKEDWKVKLSLFDVSTPSDPKEIAKYNLDESYSDVLSTHHAFLQDSKHNIFFMPGSKGGYIFSYENDKLSLTKAISQRGVRRAIYINDYLYIISDNKISVLNEKDWERINELDI